MLLTPSPTVAQVPIELPVKVDKASFEQFVMTQATAVHTYCYRMLGSTYLAESIAQTAFFELPCYKFECFLDI